MSHWLMKSEPSCYSIDDLARDKTTHWDGVRNYQARNMLRDQIKLGDLVFFYHSNAKPTGIAGVAEVVREGYPDFTAFYPDSDHPDLSTTPDNPRWYMVDIAFKQKFSQVVSLQTLREHPDLHTMQLLKKGNRLSVMPVSDVEWQIIIRISSAIPGAAKSSCN